MSAEAFYNPVMRAWLSRHFPDGVTSCRYAKIVSCDWEDRVAVDRAKAIIVGGKHYHLSDGQYDMTKDIWHCMFVVVTTRDREHRWIVEIIDPFESFYDFHVIDCYPATAMMTDPFERYITLIP